MSVLGIDIGSSRVKAVAFDAECREIAAAYAAYPLLTPEPGAMELDSGAVLTACFRVIAEVAAATNGRDPIRALGISSQGEAFTPVDAAGTLLAPAMISGDTRATAAMARFTASFGRDRLYRITGHTPSGMFSLAKLLYLAEKHPEIRRKAVKFLCFEDLLCHALGVSPAMGWPLAGRTLFFDVNEHRWSEEILAAAGFTPEEFARPLPPGDIAGVIPEHIARELNLSSGVQIVCGGHDQVIGAFGCGVRPGSAMYAAGSVECIVPVTHHLPQSEALRDANLCGYDYALPGAFASVAYSLTGSNLLQYFMENFAPELQSDYAKLVDSMPAEPTPLLVLPYFTASGTPYFDSVTPGTVFGWRLGMSRGTLLKGLQEGIGMEMKLNFELLNANGFDVGTLIAAGGGFRDAAMVQLRADILNRPIRVTSVREPGCRGAAGLALTALTGTPPPPPEFTGSVTPNPKHAAHYQELFPRWQKFSASMRSLAGELSRG